MVLNHRGSGIIPWQDTDQWGKSHETECSVEMIHEWLETKATSRILCSDVLLCMTSTCFCLNKKKREWTLYSISLPRNISEDKHYIQFINFITTVFSFAPYFPTLANIEVVAVGGTECKYFLHTSGHDQICLKPLASKTPTHLFYFNHKHKY